MKGLHTRRIHVFLLLIEYGGIQPKSSATTHAIQGFNLVPVITLNSRVKICTVQKNSQD